MRISIDSDLMDEIVAFVGDQPCKKSYVLYTKLLIAVREGADRRRAEAVNPVGSVREDGNIVGEGIPNTIEPAAAGSKTRNKEAR